MTDPLRLMCILAHPDDESLGTGGILARYAAEGVETYVVTATRGERGWDTSAADYPGIEGLGRIREAELRAACDVLKVKELQFLDYIDGDLDQANPAEAIARIVPHIRRIKPQVVVTFDPFGAYGHPDHIAISQFTNAACVCAADSSYGEGESHRVPKLYYLTDRKDLIEIYTAAFGEISMTIDGVLRQAMPWEDWAITTRINADDYWRQVWDACRCHKTQVGSLMAMSTLTEDQQRQIWSPQTFYRAYSLVNGGRKNEDDMFEGLRS
jgi:LmbE family N-acetylglucosaminyl deacetylase